MNILLNRSGGLPGGMRQGGGRRILLGVASAVLALGVPLASAQTSEPAVVQAQGGARSDLAIEADVLHGIASKPSLQGQGIAASTEDGTVTLTGSVDDAGAREQAQQTAASVPGVRAVVNHLQVGGQAGHAAAPKAGAPPPPSNAPAPGPQGRQDAASGAAPPYTQDQQPTAGSVGNWGPAGPPPDAQNGRIPPPAALPSGGQADEQPSAAPPAYPSPASPPQSSAGGPGPRVGYPRQQTPDAGGYPPAYPSSRPPMSAGSAAYGAHGPSEPERPEVARGPVTLPPGTLLAVRTSEPLDTRKLQSGDYFQVIAAQDIFSGEALAVPRGAVLQGRVLEVKRAGVFKGSAGLALQLTNLNLSGNAYPIATDTFVSDTRGKGGYTTANTAGAAAIGALIGAVAGGGGGAAIGAVAGGATGAGISAATPGPREVLPPETSLTFHLQAPVTLEPVSYREAQRLAASVAPPRRPYLRPRTAPYGPYPPYPPYPY